MKPSKRVVVKQVKDTITKPTTVEKTTEAKQDELKKEDKSNGIIYKVQIGTSPKKVALESKNFKGLEPISMNELNKSFVYLYGETTDIQEAKQFLATAKSKGYTTAFIVPFKNGQKISLQEALKL